MNQQDLTMIKKIILTTTLSILSLVTYAGEHGDMQVDCRAKQIRFVHDKVWLNQNITRPEAHLYIIHNLDKTHFWLNHDSEDPMNAGWSSQIGADHWSAIQMSQTKFNLTCTEITSAGTKELDCARLLRVCLVTNVQSPAKDQLSSYWVAEDQTRPDFYKAIVARGFSFT